MALSLSEFRMSLKPRGPVIRLPGDVEVLP